MAEINTPLVSDEELALLQTRVLERQSRQVVATTYGAGQHRSRFRGLGLDLEDTRPYHSGDDIRHMDWRATARSGKPTMKVFREERQRSLFIVADRGPTMAFGTRGELKAAVAARAAAILAFSALAQHETVAGLVVERSIRFFPSSRGLNQTLRLLKTVSAPLPPTVNELTPTQTDDLFSTLYQMASPGSVVFLISDFYFLDGKHRTALAELAEHRHVVALHITDPAEDALPNAGLVRLVSPVTNEISIIDTSDKTLRHAYYHARSQRLEELNNLFSGGGIPLQHLYTNGNTFAELEEVW